MIGIVPLGTVLQTTCEGDEGPSSVQKCFENAIGEVAISRGLLHDMGLRWGFPVTHWISCKFLIRMLLGKKCFCD